MTFIIRLTCDETGRIGGIVERVRTGQKARFHALDALAEVIAQMVTREATNHEPKG